MKKVLIIFTILLTIAGCSANNAEIATPFEHTLFITKEDLTSTNLSKFHYVENQDTSNHWKQNERHKNDTFNGTINIYPNKNIEPLSDYILIDVFARENNSVAQEDLEVRIMVNSTISPNLQKNYQNLGDENFYYTIQDDNENLAYIAMRKEKYIITIQAVSLQSSDTAEREIKELAQLYLEKISKL